MCVRSKLEIEKKRDICLSSQLAEKPSSMPYKCGVFCASPSFFVLPSLNTWTLWSVVTAHQYTVSLCCDFWWLLIDNNTHTHKQNPTWMNPFFLLLGWVRADRNKIHTVSQTHMAEVMVLQLTGPSQYALFFFIKTRSYSCSYSFKL